MVSSVAHTGRPADGSWPATDQIDQPRLHRGGVGYIATGAVAEDSQRTGHRGDRQDEVPDLLNEFARSIPYRSSERSIASRPLPRRESRTRARPGRELTDGPSENHYTLRVTLTLATFKADKSATAHLPMLTTHPAVVQRLLDLLNDPQNEARMVSAEEHDRPPLAGVIRLIEGDSALTGAMTSRTSGKKFRELILVAVRLKMLDMGWSTIGRESQVPDSKFYFRAARFKR
jgi:hypothetical protein